MARRINRCPPYRINAWRLEDSCLLSLADAEPDLVVVGKVSFNPKDVLGHGAGGTFVFRWVTLGACPDTAPILPGSHRDSNKEALAQGSGHWFRDFHLLLVLIPPILELGSWPSLSRHWVHRTGPPCTPSLPAPALAPGTLPGLWLSPFPAPNTVKSEGCHFPTKLRPSSPQLALGKISACG